MKKMQIYALKSALEKAGFEVDADEEDGLIELLKIPGVPMETCFDFFIVMDEPENIEYKDLFDGAALFNEPLDIWSDLLFNSLDEAIAHAKQTKHKIMNLFFKAGLGGEAPCERWQDVILQGYDQFEDLDEDDVFDALYEEDTPIAVKVAENVKRYTNLLEKHIRGGGKLEKFSPPASSAIEHVALDLTFQMINEELEKEENGNE